MATDTRKQKEFRFKLLTLLIETGGSVLEKLLTDRYPGIKLWQEICVHTLTGIDELRSKWELSDEQASRLKPDESGTLKVESFDVSLLAKLLVNLCGNDAALKSTVTGIRTFRNDNYGHLSKLELTANDFTKQWYDLTHLLRELAKHVHGPDTTAFKWELESEILKLDGAPFTEDMEKRLSLLDYDFLKFSADELMPAVERLNRISRTQENRDEGHCPWCLAQNRANN